MARLPPTRVSDSQSFLRGSTGQAPQGSAEAGPAQEEPAVSTSPGTSCWPWRRQPDEERGGGEEHSPEVGEQVGRAARGKTMGAVVTNGSGPRTEGQPLFRAAVPRRKPAPALQPAWALGTQGSGAQWDASRCARTVLYLFVQELY